jgi:hypothetical protein
MASPTYAGGTDRAEVPFTVRGMGPRTSETDKATEKLLYKKILVMDVTAFIL